VALFPPAEICLFLSSLHGWIFKVLTTFTSLIVTGYTHLSISLTVLHIRPRVVGSLSELDTACVALIVSI